MPTPNAFSAPEFRDWSFAAVRLLQGAVYADDPRSWEIVLRSRSQLESHFIRIGLVLVVDENEGYAYVRQWSDEECPDGYEELPTLIKRVPLGYGPTLLAVLLRDELRRYEAEEVHNERCVVDGDSLLDQWKLFFPAQQDEVKQRKDFASAMAKLDALGFAKRFSESPEQWEVKKILKAKLPASELEQLRSQLVDAVSERTEKRGSADA